MSSKFMGLMVAIYIIMIILGATMDAATNYDISGQWQGAGSESIFSYLTNFSNATQQFSTFGAISLPVPNTDYFNAMFQVMTLRFSWMMDGSYMQMIYYVAFLPLTAMGVLFSIMFFIGIIRGNISFGGFLFVVPYVRMDIPKFNKRKKKWEWKDA